MKKVLPLFLTLCLLAATCPIAIAGEATDFSGYGDEALLALLDDVQSEIVARKIEKTAHLTAGTYIGGRDIPVGSYILAAAGNENEHGIISLSSPNDSEEGYSLKLYQHKNGEETYSVFVNIEDGDTLTLPFPYTLTISGGVMFK